MACYPGQPRGDRDDPGDTSDTEHDFGLHQNLPSTQVIVKWLEANYHYEEGVCLPRSTIYEHYLDFCQRENRHPVNAASFGKLIRQQFSSLTTRRLGTRGKSKYHYFGLGIKPSSLYYDEEYLKRQKEGVSKKDLDSKKSHLMYSNENPSATLPPFPDIDTLKLSPSLPKDKLNTFMVMYRTHCQRILDSVARANFFEVENFLLHFWQAMPPHLLPVLASETVVDLVALCDTLLYSVISSVLIVSPVQSFPESLLQEVLKFCSHLGPWLMTATNGLPEPLTHTKQQVAKTFVKTLKRQLALIQLAKAARNALQRDNPLAQLRKDWEALDMHSVLAEILYTVQPLDLPPSSLYRVPKFLSRFVSLLENKTSVEDFVDWGQTLLNSCIKPCSEGKDLFQISRVFLLTWKLFTAKITREFTLQNAPSFGTFHLLHMLMYDYIVHQLKCRLEKQQQRQYELKIAQHRDNDLVVADIHVEDRLLSNASTPLNMGPLPSMHTCHDSHTSHTSLPPFEQLAQTTKEPTGIVTPPATQHTATMEMHSSLPGGGGGAPPSLPESPLLEPHLLPRESGPPTNPQLTHPHKQVPTSTPTSTVPSLPPQGGDLVGTQPPLPAPSHLPPAPTIDNTTLSVFPILSQTLQQPISLASSTAMHSQPSLRSTPNPLHPHPPTSNAGMTQFMQGLHSIQTVFNPHQSSANLFTNPLTATPFGAPLTSMAGSLTHPAPSLPLLPTLPNMYSYGPYGGVGGVPVVPSGPIGVGVVGSGPASCNSGPGLLPGPPFPTPSLMPTYSSYLPPSMYPSHHITTPSST